MSAELTGVCEECGKADTALLVSSGGDKLCEQCCNSQEGGLETVAVDQMGEWASQLCIVCNAVSPDLLPTPEGRMLCPDCYWNEESQRSTIAPDLGAQPDDSDSPDSDFEAATIAEIPPVLLKQSPGNCEACGKGALQRLPSSDGRLLCTSCITTVESGKSTFAMPTPARGLASAINRGEGTCQACNQISTSLVVASDGRRMCADCYIELE